MLDVPSEISRVINSYAVNSLSSDEDLYYETKRINPNFSLQMEYYNHLVESRKTTYDASADIEKVYKELKDINFILTLTDEEYIQVDTDERWIFKNVFGDNFDEDNSILRGDNDFFYYVMMNQRGYIVRNTLDSLRFELNVPEGYYYEEYSQEFVDIIKNEGLSLYEIADKQQRYYNMTKTLPTKLKDYVDLHRRNIRAVEYHEIKRTISITTDTYYGFVGDLEIFKSIVAYLHHPGNIVYENSTYSCTEEAYKYYTLDDI